MVSLDMLVCSLIAFGRVVHPDWCGSALAGRIIAVPNTWHADVLFDGWKTPVRALQDNLQWEPLWTGKTPDNAI